ncbi:helix-turn-helix domain-containing protein [Leuconostoc citreum]|uniref:helix-turn-helix domain-containing protein n=1 Tax=Leuconostoc citreum TaxID=33964 RepID=UPI0032DFF517
MEHNRIKELREKNKLTLKEAAKGTGIDFTTLSKYENGVVKTGKVETWKKLADYFGVSIAYLQNADDFFNKQFHDDKFDRYELYLKKRGINLDLRKYDDSTNSAFVQYELNQLDNALNMGNIDLRSLPDNEINKITDTFQRLYVSLYGMPDKKNKKFYNTYFDLLESMSDLAINLHIADEHNASDTFREHTGFDRSDVTNILKTITDELTKKSNIANDFDAEQGKFWDVEKQTYTDDIPRTSHLSQAEKLLINKKAQNKKATDD